jgi:quercetin dioxygenase-like cupin family protein
VPSVQPFHLPEWKPISHPDASGVEVRVIWQQDDLLLALLRFAERANVHEHAGPNDAYVSCLEGSGYTKIGDETEPIEAGQRVFWPKGIVHGLWTEGSPMITLMCERYSSPSK